MIVKKQLKIIKKFVDVVRGKGYYPNIPIIRSAATQPEVNTEGVSVKSFSTNNYLGLSYHPRVKNAISVAIKKYGMGSGGPRLLSGNLDIHNKLEEYLAKQLGYESCITFTTGYMGNIGVIPPLANPFQFSLLGKVVQKDQSDVAIFSDEFNHGSVVDGCRLAKSEIVIFKHNDVEDLRKKIEMYSEKKNLMIITDGIFSMGGDLAPLREIIQIADEFKALLMVDDAHGFGVHGEMGRGSLYEFNKGSSTADVVLGTFTKAFGGIGGFMVGSKSVIDYLRITARTYILSAPIPPAITAGIYESAKIIFSEEGENLRKKAWENANYLKDILRNNNFNILNTESLIIPILIGDEVKTRKLSNELLKHKIFIPAVTYPAVPWGESRLRFVATALQDKEMIKLFVDTLIKVIK